MFLFSKQSDAKLDGLRYEVKIPMEAVQLSQFHHHLHELGLYPMRPFPPRKVSSVYYDTRNFDDYTDNVSGIANNYKSGISNIRNPNIISKICIFFKQKKKIKIFYENSKSKKFPERDFIHIKDIIKIYRYLIFKNKKKLNIINCCSSKKLSLLTIINLIEKKLRKKINYKLKELPKNECLKIFGTKPKILLKTQSHASLINSTVNWHLKIK